MYALFLLAPLSMEDDSPKRDNAVNSTGTIAMNLLSVNNTCLLAVSRLLMQYLIILP